MKLIFSNLVFLLLVSFTSNAARVDTVNVYSNGMHKSSKCVVILPDSYSNKNNRFPVVYLLHGYSGNYSDWIKKVPHVKNNADQFQIIIVCPDGNYNSWYVDSPVDSSIRYETYISTEIPHFIDSAYRTKASRNFRAITGLSMGGQGALFVAWKHADFFGAAGSMSGVQELRPWKDKYELVKVLGNDDANFDNYSVANLVKKVPSILPAIIFDCGTEDPFIETNRKLHNRLSELKIPHDYTERNGNHSWPYWGNAISFQILFFDKYFKADSPSYK